MRQEIYDDEYGVDAWDTENTSRCFVHALNSEQWSHVTGKKAPTKPPSAKDYTSVGLPWFDYYNDKKTAIGGSQILSNLDSLATKIFKKGKGPLQNNEPIPEPKVIDLPKLKLGVKDGKW